MTKTTIQAEVRRVALDLARPERVKVTLHCTEPADGTVVLDLPAEQASAWQPGKPVDIQISTRERVLPV